MIENIDQSLQDCDTILLPIFWIWGYTNAWCPTNVVMHNLIDSSDSWVPILKIKTMFFYLGGSSIPTNHGMDLYSGLCNVWTVVSYHTLRDFTVTESLQPNSEESTAKQSYFNFLQHIASKQHYERNIVWYIIAKIMAFKKYIYHRLIHVNIPFKAIFAAFFYTLLSINNCNWRNWTS